MNALKAHYRYVVEQDEKKRKEEREKEHERVANMTPEERAEYEKQKEENRKQLEHRLTELFSVYSAIPNKPYR